MVRRRRRRSKRKSNNRKLWIWGCVALFTLAVILVVDLKPWRRKHATVSDEWPYHDLTKGEYTKDFDGLDLSRHQGKIHWDELVDENPQLKFVYLKATEGGDNIDKTYAYNIELAHKYGLKVGSYHFFRPKTDLTKQLENFRTQCRPEDQDLLPMIDIETKSGLPTEEFCDSLLKFLSMVEKEYKQKPLLYTFTNFYDNYLSGKIDGYKLMIAQYTQREPVLKDGRDITMWQYTGKGRINGINGFVDKSRFLKNHGLREIRFHH